MKTIAIIGCGNLGTAIAKGLLESGYTADKISATRRNIVPKTGIEFLAEKGVRVSSDNRQAVIDSEIIILAVKPHNIEAISKSIADLLDGSKHILISLATGITTTQLCEWLGTSEIPLVRAMPNTAADVGASITCIYTQNCNTEQQEWVRSLFDSIGECIFINEELMEAATIIGACGVAYVLRFIRAMIQGGIQVGFDAKTATKIVTQTVKGAAELLILRGEHPEHEIDKVTTPKGCTIVGLNEMEHAGFSSALIKGIVASFKAIEK